MTLTELPPRQSPKFPVYSAGFRSSLRYIVCPSAFWYVTYRVSAAVLAAKAGCKQERIVMRASIASRSRVIMVAGGEGDARVLKRFRVSWSS